MRYIKQQIFKTTVFDKDITSLDDIKSLMETFKKSSVDLFIEYRDARTERTITRERARIISADSNSIDIFAFDKGGSIVEHNIDFLNILLVKLVTKSDNVIVNNEDNITKFDLVDIEITSPGEGIN